MDAGIPAGENIDFAKIVKEKTEGRGADVILDLVGANYFAANLQSLAVKGRLMLVGLTGGATAEFNLGMLLMKRGKITGTVLRSRPDSEKAEATAKFAADVVPLLESGKAKAVIDKVFPLEEVKAAYEYLESNASFGKVVLDLQA